MNRRQFFKLIRDSLLAVGLTTLPHMSVPETFPKVTPISNKGGYYVPPEYASELFNRMSWSGVDNSVNSYTAYMFYSWVDNGHNSTVYTVSKGSTDNPPLP